MKKEVLRFENIHCMQDKKSLINGLFFRAFQGETCGVMVDNMREKEYLIQFLRGKLQPVYGWTYFEENKIVSAGAKELLQKQIGFVGLLNGTFHELSVAENIYAASIKTKWYESMKQSCEGAEELLENLNMEIHKEDKVKNLDAGLLKQIELLRCYVSGCRVVVLEDIGVLITESQLKAFFGLVERLKRRGITFIYIAHSSTRLFAYANHITIIKKGRTIGYMNHDNFSRSHIYTQLFGKGAKNGYLENTFTEEKSGEKKVLEFRKVKVGALQELNVSVNAGEILSILDLDGIDSCSVLRILKGECPIQAGKIYLNGLQYRPRSVCSSIRDGIAFIDEIPLDKMLFMDMSVLDNLVFMFSYRKRGVFARKKYKHMIMNLVKDIFTEEELVNKAYLLSDESRLKLLYYRWILLRPKVLVCNKPFASIDFGMRQITVNLLQTAAQAGIAVVILTTQFQEAYTMKGKNITFQNGEIN